MMGGHDAEWIERFNDEGVTEITITPNYKRVIQYFQYTCTSGEKDDIAKTKKLLVWLGEYLHTLGYCYSTVDRVLDSICAGSNIDWILSFDVTNPSGGHRDIDIHHAFFALERCPLCKQ